MQTMLTSSQTTESEQELFLGFSVFFLAGYKLNLLQEDLDEELLYWLMVKANTLIPNLFISSRSNYHSVQMELPEGQ